MQAAHATRKPKPTLHMLYPSLGSVHGRICGHWIKVFNQQFDLLKFFLKIAHQFFSICSARAPQRFCGVRLWRGFFSFCLDAKRNKKIKSQICFLARAIAPPRIWLWPPRIATLTLL
jgi:hypothetical protein